MSTLSDAIEQAKIDARNAATRLPGMPAAVGFAFRMLGGKPAVAIRLKGIVAEHGTLPAEYLTFDVGLAMTLDLTTMSPSFATLPECAGFAVHSGDPFAVKG